MGPSLNVELFKMQMLRLASYIHTPIEIKIAMDEYYPKLQYISDKHFADVINHMIENVQFKEYRSFPLISEFFNVTRIMVSKDAPPEERKNIEPYGAYAGYINKIFRAMDEIYKTVCGNIERSVKTYTKMRDYYREKAKQCLVYSLQTRQWVNRETCTFDCFDPAGF